MKLPALPPEKTTELLVFTAVITTILTLASKKVVTILLQLVVKVSKAAFETLYRYLAPKLPSWITLRRYRRSITRSKLSTIENPVGPGISVQLEHAFAPLKLISAESNETVELFSHVARYRKTIILGGAGTGKTTLMKSLVQHSLKRPSKSPFPEMVPVFITLRKLASQGNSVYDQIVGTFAEYNFPRADRFVQSMLNDGKMLVILDGLDEVGVNRSFVSQAIREFCEEDERRYSGTNRLLVTCRESGYKTADLRDVIQTVVRVEPFTNHHIRTFLQGWPEHRGRNALNLYSLIQADPPIRDVCRNPLLLTILTGLYLDADNFEWPHSRQHFYDAAIGELLSNRPARRGINQKFGVTEKRRILEIASLTRLELTTASEDPEELTVGDLSAAINHMGRSLGSDSLLSELVEVNGILRETGDSTYTFAHRTIQEYFAAREAIRTRTVVEILQTGELRDDFSEVILFYCALIQNIPQVHEILKFYIKRERFIFACRCLLSASVDVEEQWIKTIVVAISNATKDPTDPHEATILLSSLSQLRGRQYNIARHYFRQLLDAVVENLGMADPGAIGSALATTPQAAMQVIPAMLHQDDPAWKKVAVYLLRDVGTDEALDLLVRQLDRPTGSPERIAAGRVLAELANSRRDAVLARANLLPARDDQLVWPLNRYFPARIAIPIVEALAEGNSIPKRAGAIYCAAEVLSSRSTVISSTTARLHTHWRRLSRDLWLHDLKLKAAKLMLQLVTLLLALFTMLVVLAGHLGERDQMVHVISFSRDVHEEVSVHYFTRTSELASQLLLPPAELKTLLSRRYELNQKRGRSGVFSKWISDARRRFPIQPRVLGPQPRDLIPPDAARRHLARGRYYPLLSPEGFAALRSHQPDNLVDINAFNSLQATLDSLQRLVPPGPSRIVILPHSILHLSAFALTLLTILAITLVSICGMSGIPLRSFRNLSLVWPVNAFMLTMLGSSVVSGFVQGSGWMLMAPFTTLLMLTAFALAMRNSDFPYNICLADAQDMIRSPHSESGLTITHDYILNP